MHIKFFSLLFFVFITISFTGCGEEPKSSRPETSDDSETSHSGNPPKPTLPATTSPTKTLTPPAQNPYHVERYNKELKPKAPKPDSTKTTICTKSGSPNTVIVVYEYFLSQPPPEIAGTALMCDWLENKKMQHFATVERNFCSKKAQERITELKKTGYSCTP